MADEGGDVTGEGSVLESSEPNTTSMAQVSVDDSEGLPLESASEPRAGLDAEDRHVVLRSSTSRLTRKREQLEHQFYQQCAVLTREFHKATPSARYLWKGLEIAEKLNQEVMDMIQAERDEATEMSDEQYLQELNTHESDLSTYTDLLADVSGHLERSEHWQGVRTRSQTAHAASHRTYAAGTYEIDTSHGTRSADHRVERSGFDSERAPPEWNHNLEDWAIGAASLDIVNETSPMRAPVTSIQSTGTVSVQGEQAAFLALVQTASAHAASQGDSSPRSETTAAVGNVQVPASLSVPASTVPVLSASRVSMSAADAPATVRAPLQTRVPSVPSQLSSERVTRSQAQVQRTGPTAFSSNRNVSFSTGGTPQFRSVNVLPAYTYGTAKVNTCMASHPPPSSSVGLVPPAVQPSVQFAHPGATHQHWQTPPTTSLAGAPVHHQYAGPSYQQPVSGPQYGHAYLTPLALPKFTGNAGDYIQWRQRFLQVIRTNQTMPEELKLARLREALEGSKAAEVVSGIFEGNGAYQAAWTELDSWYGGQDRHMEQQRRTIINHPRITNEKDLDALQQYAIKLRNVLANMRTSGIVPSEELYLIATEKIPRPMLVRYFDHHGSNTNDVVTFSVWLVERLKTQRRAIERTDGMVEKPEQRRHRTLVSNQVESPAAEPPSVSVAKPKPPEQTRCPKCRNSHALRECYTFKALGVQKRWDLVKLLELCVRCLEPGHFAKECKASSCNKCSATHHNLLHYDKKPKKAPSAAEKKKLDACNNSCATGNTQAVAFMTVKVTIKGPTGSTTQATALLDSGSSASYVTHGIVQRLGLQTEKCLMETTVLGGSTITGDVDKASLNVGSLSSDYEAKLDAWVLPKITAAVPPVGWKELRASWKHLENLPPMADPSDTVDLLIGLDAAELHASLEERACATEGGPTARKTELGWVLFGPSSLAKEHCSSTTLIGVSQRVSGQDEVLSELVKKFWSLESVGMQPQEQTADMTSDEKAAEESTVATLAHDGERFEVGIPWTSGNQQPETSCNFKTANQRLGSLLRMLEKKPDVKVRYAAVLEEYLRKGYIQQVQDASPADTSQWFLPHFAVVREDKATTKVRIVFDGAARDGQHPSINELMYAGPKLQNNMVHILLRFCQEPVALAADVSEMFLQVKLRQEDRRYHRFLWQTDRGLVVYEFMRLVFGIKASPYLAGRALLETANKFAHTTSEMTQRAVREDFYVDDLLSSCKTEDEAIRLQADVQGLLKKGGFHIRKWTSSSLAVIQRVPEADRATNTEFAITDQDAGAVPTQKTLGVSWSCKTDCFTFNYAEPKEVKLTRRGVLSQMCRLFDPRGQLAPFTIRARILFQEACIRDTGWDELMDDELSARWRCWFAELPELAKITIPRCFKSLLSDSPLSLHTFTDASDLAYAAVVYTRQELPDGSAKISLAMAKARPSPVRKKTIPMLELQGAVLGVRVASEVAKALGVPVERRHFWTDSMNVLYWVRSPSRKFKVEVANRVSQIQDGSTPNQWQHVPGKHNPADIGSRGASAKQLSEKQEWWTGPTFLQMPGEEWQSRQIIVPAELPGQLKRNTCLAAATASRSRLHPDNYSSWKRLKRVTAWCRRFIAKASKGRSCVTREADEEKTTRTGQQGNVTRIGDQDVSELSVAEVDRAELYWIQRAQQEGFAQTFNSLVGGHELLATDSLLKLRPCVQTVDGLSVMLVGGRLSTSHHLPLTLRHPIILPPRHRVTTLIIEDEDERCGHTVGPNHILSNLAVRYWLVKGKAVVREHRHRCVRCRRQWAKAATPLMGSLPSFRTNGPLLAFSNVAVDYAGPFLTRQGRGRSQMKRYVCLFSCLQTRACHLEMVNSLDLDGFLMAFTRFSKRRGTPQRVVSDNGSNFIAAERELREAIASFDQGQLAAKLAVQNVHWQFNPPRAPHFGGVVESMVKCVKRALFHVLHQASLSDEELLTALVHAESLLNSRPLTVIKSDGDDLEPLTPNHFLIGRIATVTALEGITEEIVRPHPQRRWEYVQILIKQVWRRWLREIVPKHNVRSKWFKMEKAVAVGDVFLVVDDQQHRATWPLGRVVEVHPGSDGITRAVDIKIAGKVYRRAVHRLVPLEVDQCIGEQSTTAEVAIPELL